jgi:hypothetical protein
MPGMPGGSSGGGEQAGGSAQRIDPALGAAAQPILNQMAANEAPAGAQPVGSPIVGNYQQGQTLESELQLQGGKCYTVVAAGLPPISEVNIRIVAVTPIPGQSMVLASDQGSGAQAVLGKKPNCYRNPAPFAVPAKVIVEAAGGQGVIAAQVYEK